MEIVNGVVFDGYNYPNKLTDLFNAMKNGDIIPEIILNDKYKKAKGNNIVTDFKADMYCVGLQTDGKGQWFDYVDGTSSNEIDSFYMNWVKSFKL